MIPSYIGYTNQTFTKPKRTHNRIFFHLEREHSFYLVEIQPMGIFHALKIVFINV